MSDEYSKVLGKYRIRLSIGHRIRDQIEVYVHHRPGIIKADIRFVLPISERDPDHRRWSSRPLSGCCCIRDQDTPFLRKPRSKANLGWKALSKRGWAALSRKLIKKKLTYGPAKTGLFRLGSVPIFNFYYLARLRPSLFPNGFSPFLIILGLAPCLVLPLTIVIRFTNFLFLLPSSLSCEIRVWNINVKKNKK